MIKRVCPSCKAAWFSFEVSKNWTCSKCNAIIPISLNEPAEEVPSKEEDTIKNRE